MILESSTIIEVVGRYASCRFYIAGSQLRPAPCENLTGCMAAPGEAGEKGGVLRHGGEGRGTGVSNREKTRIDGERRPRIARASLIGTTSRTATALEPRTRKGAG